MLRYGLWEYRTGPDLEELLVVCKNSPSNDSCAVVSLIARTMEMITSLKQQSRTKVETNDDHINRPKTGRSVSSRRDESARSGRAERRGSIECSRV